MSTGVILFDAAAAWRLRTMGWEPAEWLERLRKTGSGRDQGFDRCTQWRLLPDAAPSGRWASMLTLVVRERKCAYLTFESFDVGGGTMYATSHDPSATPSPRAAQLILPAAMPDTMIAALPGRPVSTVLEHPVVGAAVVRRARSLNDERKTLLWLDPPSEQVALPWSLMP